MKSEFFHDKEMRYSGTGQFCFKIREKEGEEVCNFYYYNFIMHFKTTTAATKCYKCKIK